MAPGRTLALPTAAAERWCQHVGGEVSHIAEATGFVNFELSFDPVQQQRVLSPSHCVITWSNRDKGRARYTSSLLSLRIVPEDALPEQIQVGVEVRGKDGESVLCGGEYLEFELLSLPSDAAKQSHLAVASGPVRVNPETKQREFMRIDLGRCLRQIVADVIDDPKHKGQKLCRQRWWICVRVLRLVCSANSLSCAALDEVGVAPLEWVLCILDERAAPRIAAAASTGTNEPSIDELAKFIDGGAKKAKPKKKPSAGARVIEVDAVGEKSGTEDVGVSDVPAMPRIASSRGAIRPAPPPGWSRTVDLAPSLIDAWRDLAGCDVRHVAESTGFVHFAVSRDEERKCREVTPSSYVLAFPRVAPGQRYQSALLTIKLVDDKFLEELGGARACRTPGQGDKASDSESLLFELFSKQDESVDMTPLRFTAGPVRINAETGQRESMRLDLGSCVHWATPDIVDGTLGGRQQRLLRQRWSVSLETLKLVCVANELDCSGLESKNGPPLEW
ncbi:unnamed protein product, partial [Polarella glacialis]